MTLYDTAVRSRAMPVPDQIGPRFTPRPKPERTHLSAESRMMLFRAEVQQSPDVQLLRLHGELDAAGAGILSEMISCERQIAASRRAELRLDLSAVTFMDSVALRALLRARRASERSGEAFTVGVASEPVLRLLEDTEAADLGDVLPVPA